MGYFDSGWTHFYLPIRHFLLDELLHLEAKPLIIPRFNGGPHWSPRNSQPRTPPGPEGSNGSGYAVCRGVAGEGHRHTFSYLQLSPVISSYLLFFLFLYLFLKHTLVQLF